MKPLIIAAVLASGLIGTNVQGIPPEEIAAAIEQGRAGKTLQKKCHARGDNGMDIVAEGPIGRIMRAARDAKKKNKEFTGADVTQTMAGAWVTVTATRDEMLLKEDGANVTPNTPGNSRYITELVIKSKPSGSEKAIVLYPLGRITYSIDKSQHHYIATGGPIPATMALPGSSMEASFDLAAFKAIPHKDVEIYAFMTDTGGHGCKISANERQALR